MLGWSNAEQVLYSTVFVEVRGAEGVATGTGFFGQFTMPNGKSAIVLVSCRHLFEDAVSVRYWANIQGVDGGPSGQFYDVNYAGIHSLTVHPDPEVDLAGFIVHHIDNRLFEHQQQRLFYMSLPETVIPAAEQWDDVAVADDIYVIGCPHGLVDDVHRTPLVRKGVIANFHRDTNRPFFYIDVPTLAGSSGSPVIIDSHYSFDRKAGKYELRSRFYLVGIVTSGLEAESHEGPTDLHLGKVVRSDQLSALYEAILGSQGGTPAA